MKGGESVDDVLEAEAPQSALVGTIVDVQSNSAEMEAYLVFRCASVPHVDAVFNELKAALNLGHIYIDIRLAPTVQK